MNHLYFSSNFKLINLTPFKYSLCVLINAFLKDKELLNNFVNLKLFDILVKILNETKCEISKNYFFNKIKISIEEYFQNETSNDLNEDNQINKRNMSDYIFSILESNYKKIKSINDLYILFNYEIRELQLKNESNESLIEKGGVIDNFIRKVLLAFYKLSFEELCKLFSDLLLYIKGEELIIQLSNRESEILFERQMSDLSKIAKDSYDEKILDSINYKHKYYHLAKLNIQSESALFDIHKFFDYNMKYFYNDTSQSDTKIHYSLMNLIEFYFNNGYYEYAIQETIKLNQSNCDHEGLLKCFLWMQKIYRNSGNHEMAKKFLSTCLIKSFENNFTLLYLISTTELAILNYNFFSSIGDKNYKLSKHDNTFQSIEEKILSLSSSYNYSYKNLLQFLSSSKGDFVNEKSPDFYLKFVYVNIILNLSRKGKNSLTLSYTKKFLDFILIKQNDLENRFDLMNLSLETIEIILNLLFELYEYDTDYIIKKFEEIFCSLSSNKDINKLNYVIYILKQKFLSFSLINLKSLSVEIKSSEFIQIRNNFYYITYLKYLELENSFQNFKYCKINQHFETEKELTDYITTCKKMKFMKFKILSKILLTKVFIIKGKTTEALFEITKMLKKLEKIDEEYLTMKLKLVLLEIYSKMKNFSKVEKLLEELEISIDNIGNISDKYEFYLIKTQMVIINSSNENKERCQNSDIKNLIFYCFNYALLSNNSGMINNSLFLIDIYELSIGKSYQTKSYIKETIKCHLDQLQKLLSIFENFPVSSSQSLELIKVIHSNNMMTIKNLRKYLNN